METPPLTRGRRREARGLGRRLGNTPAYAGKTGGEPPAAPRRRKHPRLRGEDTGPTNFSSTALETPPLTRGRLVSNGFDHEEVRNTPAYAGKTILRFWRKGSARKHPRLRGEDAVSVALAFVVGETPPLTRGRPCDRSQAVRDERNTPAYAGKTFRPVNWAIGRRKHPRLRGEDRGCRDCGGTAEETPPLTRGRHLLAHV